MHKIAKSGLWWLWVTVLILLLDRITKVLADAYLSVHSALNIFPGFNLFLSYNKGAAFSFLDTMPGQTYLFGVIAITVSTALIIWLRKIPCRHVSLSIALSLIIGGALGNLWDRISYGHVVDFIQLYVSHYYWPVFNIADSAVCVGAFILLLTSFQDNKKSG